MRQSVARVSMLVASAGVALAARAQVTTQLNVEASVDGGATWTSSVEAIPGQPVHFRLRVELVGATATGLAGLTLQPTLSNWQGSNTLLPFTFPGLNSAGQGTSESAYAGRHVAGESQVNTGRIFPFGASGQGPESSCGLLTSHVDAGNVLRFAGSRSVSNFAPGWGVQISQLPQNLAGSNFNGSSDVVVFRYATVFSGAPSIPSIASAIRVHGQQVMWYQGASATNPLETSFMINPATVVPSAPGVVCLLTFGGMAALRRRR
jgi:hypothetical protein